MVITRGSNSILCSNCGKNIQNKNIDLSSTPLCKGCKKRKSLINKYGSLENAESERKKNIIKKYGSLEKFNEKRKHSSESTIIKKYGSLQNYSNFISIELSRSNMNKYGVPNVSQVPEILSKINESLKINHPDWSFKKDFIKNDSKLKKKYVYNDTAFDSSWELVFYIWLKDQNINFEYHPKIKFNYLDSNGKNHLYYPDFKVNNDIIEIKGNQFFDDQDNPISKVFGSWKEKYECMIDNNIKILRYEQISKYIKYVKVKYGKYYLDQFKSKPKISTTIDRWNSIKIKCVETGEIFHSMSEAKRQYGGKIVNSLRTGKPTKGKHYQKV